jgi:hypothetical protein
MFRSVVSTALYALCVSAATNWIVPGAVWYDTAGAKIDAHGGMIYQNGNTFYWVRISLASMITSTDCHSGWTRRQQQRLPAYLLVYRLAQLAEPRLGEFGPGHVPA